MITNAEETALWDSTFYQQLSGYFFKDLGAKLFKNIFLNCFIEPEKV